MTPTVRDLHNAAMDLSSYALIAREAGHVERAAALSREALDAERRAADLVPLDPASEPTRSILYRSAAWLALDAGLPEEAIRLGNSGLAGFPPPAIAGELMDVLHAAYRRKAGL